MVDVGLGSGKEDEDENWEISSLENMWNFGIWY